MPGDSVEREIGVAFLARGLHPEWRHAFRRFVRSYRRYRDGAPHRLYVIFKGFHDAAHLREGEACFAEIPHVPLHMDDAGFDIGTYRQAASLMREELVCFLNTKSEILCPDWLAHLARALARPGVGLVGNTGSFESIHFKLPAIPKFPNPHIRTNAFLVSRALFEQVAAGFEFRSKDDGWMFECGPDGLSRQVERRGLQLLVVGRDGRTYEPEQWPRSGTYRTPRAAPLVGDDSYRAFLAADTIARRDMMAITWGPPAAEAAVRGGLGCPAGVVFA